MVFGVTNWLMCIFLIVWENIVLYIITVLVIFRQECAYLFFLFV